MSSVKVELSFHVTPQPINLSDIYVEVAHREGGAVNLTQAQVNEASARLMDVLAERVRGDKAFGLSLLALLQERGRP